MKLTIDQIKAYFSSLSIEERNALISELSDILGNSNRISRRELLNNKQGSCPHCKSNKYVKNGLDKGSQQYRCKSCNRKFTEFTGTWMAGLHKKDKIAAYMSLMLEEKSLDYIKGELNINKKTAFDWRHKILSSLTNQDSGNFTGITESDETFFRFSEKGKKNLKRKGRKRGGQSKGKGKIKDKVTVLATSDRAGHKGLDVVTMGRLSKADIAKSIGERISGNTILCSDSHLSFKGFAIDNSLKHHAVKPKHGIFTKEKIYHVQHVNSMHNKLKRWINESFWGVSTKYLQQYLNWFRMKEVLRYKNQPMSQLAMQTIYDTESYQRFNNINKFYNSLISPQT